MNKLPGSYKQRRPRAPRGSVRACRACGRYRSRDEAAGAQALGRPGLCQTCVQAVTERRPLLQPVAG